MSVAALINNLKWNAEFSNHIASAAAIAKKLKLNRSTWDESKSSHKPPYDEFNGYLALPLKFPKVLSVGVVFAVIQCFGLAVAFGLFMAGIFFTSDEIFFRIGKISISHFLFWSGIGSFILGIFVCKKVRDKMMKGIKSRIPLNDFDL